MNALCLYSNQNALSSRAQSKTTFGMFVFKTILVFMILFKNTPIYNYTFITSERIADVILLIYILLSYVKGSCFGRRRFQVKIFNKYLIFQLLLLIYSTILIAKFGSGDGLAINEDILNFVVFVPISVFGLSMLIRDTDELMKIILFICVLQSFVVLLGIISPQMANIIDNLPFNNNGGVYWTYSKYRELGYNGGIACIAAKGAIKLSFGMLACYYFICQKRNLFKYLIAFLFITVAATAVGRTGLVIALFVLVAILAKLLKNKNGQLHFLIIVLLITLSVSAIYILIQTNSLPSFSSRLNNLLLNGIYDSFLKHYFYSDTTVIPKISYETIIGTGITSGMSGNGVYINADGGFFRMYVALGLPMAIVFYFITFNLFGKMIKISKNTPLFWTFVLFFVIYLVSEFKEYDFYSRYLFVIFTTFCFLLNKNKDYGAATYV